MENKQPDKRNSAIDKRISFKPLPFDVAEAYKRLNERISHPVMISYARKSNPIWKYVSIAASIALLLSFSLYFAERKKSNELVYYETTAVPDAKTKIVLPDSSVVWLNANATLRYPRKFVGETRQVNIAGEAFFEVRKNAKKPFIVQTNGIGIRVLGTSFNVESENDKTTVTLLSGSIQLFKHTNRSQTADRTLLPGERAVFYNSGNDLTVSKIHPENTISWVTGIFIFKDNSLEEITQELQRAFHVKIHIENEYLRKQTFNAEFTEKETLEEILSILQISARYQIEKRKGEIYLK